MNLCKSVQTPQALAAAWCSLRTQLASSSALVPRKQGSSVASTILAKHRICLTRRRDMLLCTHGTIAVGAATQTLCHSRHYKGGPLDICRANKGQTLELTGVIMRSDMLPVCFKVHLPPCNSLMII